MNIEELKKIVRGNGFQESHGSTTMVIDVETVIDLLDDLKQCDIPVVVKSLPTDEEMDIELNNALQWFENNRTTAQVSLEFRLGYGKGFTDSHKWITK